MVNKIRCEKVV